MAESLRVAVVGAGPIGLEFALAAVQRGLDVELFERASSCAGHVESYEFVQLFSPWSLNTTDIGRNAVKELGLQMPDDSVFPTGREMLDGYLSPLLQVLQKSPHCRNIHFGTEVLHVARGALLKGESIGGGDMMMPKGKPLVSQARRETPFRLLVCKGEEEQYIEGFNFVVDCSGSYRPDFANWIGAGGVPAVGERSLRAKKRLWTTIPNILSSDRERFAKKRTLVVGSGMSAATTLRNLNELAANEQGTSILWLTRSETKPFTVIEDDVLPQRKALCEMGNNAAAGGMKDIEYIGGAAVKAIAQTDNGRLRITIESHTSKDPRVEEVDECVGCCGYRPDSSLYEELQVHQCYASNGPMKLAATLLGASGDCLQQVSAGVDSLRNPEPGFFILGSKSYGRNSAFLLKIGHEQVSCVLDAITPPVAAAL
jgi:thioredoxin reductase